MYKVYETALKTSMRQRDRRDNVFLLESHEGQQHYFSFHLLEQLQQFEGAFYNSLYKAIITMQVRVYNYNEIFLEEYYSFPLTITILD